LQPLDLTQAPPRSPYVQIGGLYMLARTIDKMRASLPGGNLGSYHIRGFSRQLLEALGIAEDDLLAVVSLAQSDDDVVAWVHKHSDRPAYEAINERLAARKIADYLERPGFVEKYPLVSTLPGDLPIFRLMELDDAQAFGRTPA
jgi:hypothetical protein